MIKTCEYLCVCERERKREREREKEIKCERECFGVHDMCKKIMCLGPVLALNSEVLGIKLRLHGNYLSSRGKDDCVDNRPCKRENSQKPVARVFS